MEFSAHALERMEERKISDSEVTEAIALGRRSIWLSNRAYEYKYKNLIVITAFDNMVLTAYREQYSRCQKKRKWKKWIRNIKNA